jgi:hypothetical protein
MIGRVTVLETRLHPGMEVPALPISGRSREPSRRISRRGPSR